MMNAQRSENLGDYLREFLRALNRTAAVEGPDAFSIEVLDEGLSKAERDLLK